MRLVGPVSGYSTQAQISLEVAGIINNRRIRLWFATEFNPLDNTATSNPLRIFETLDRAAKTNDRNSAKASSVADNLRAWVSLWEAIGLIDRDTQARALHAIKGALEDGSFRPVVFFLDNLTGVEKGEQPDEYRVENQPIDSPQVLQLIPPRLRMGP